MLNSGRYQCVEHGFGPVVHRIVFYHRLLPYLIDSAGYIYVGPLIIQLKSNPSLHRILRIRWHGYAVRELDHT